MENFEDFEMPASMMYPTFELDEWRILPNISLPMNYQELVPKFYEKNSREKIEKYSQELEKMCREDNFGITEIRLKWHEKQGLTNISLSTHSGLDLESKTIPRFVEHNIGFGNAFIGGTIAMKYISELLKTNKL